MVVIPIQYRSHGAHFLRKQRQIEFGIASFHHAAQGTGGIDTASRSVDGAPVTTHFLLVTSGALVFRDELFPQRQIRPVKQVGRSAARGSDHHHEE